MLESNISVKINENTQTHWNLSHRHRARDLYSKPKRYTLCFFYEALCGWGEPKNNLHNTVEKKLIPQPHLLLWVRLLIYRFMTGCVSTATSLHMCVSWQGIEEVVVQGWERSNLTNNIQRREAVVEFPHPLVSAAATAACSLSNTTQEGWRGNIYILFF